MSLTFADVVDDSMLAYAETQAALAAWIDEQTGGGSNEQKVDRVRRQVTWLPRLHKRDEVVAVAHYVGSVVNGEGRWAWADEELADSPFVRLSERLRTFGEANQIPELASPTVQAQPWVMAGVACRVTEMPASHMAPREGGVDIFVVDPAGFTVGPIAAEDFTRLMAGSLQADGFVNDHRRAVQGWAQARRMPHRWVDPGSFRVFDIGFPQGPLFIHFDEAGRFERAELQPLG
ncbi:hypothetical protein GCM10027418_31050 [Mariniluteicoccus endophyticus]